MPNWTKEQELAIYKNGCNIIVSAGAGSGKTAVLSERVLQKLKQGVAIDQLLILTFTKAAAFEMMSRIREKIKQDESLQSQLDKIDAAYITTFDSFSLSLVQKYHYLLGIDQHISIIDQNIMTIEKKKIIDRIFDRHYQNKTPSFFKLLENFTFKDDKVVKDCIFEMAEKLSLKYDVLEYLKNYEKNQFQQGTLENFILAYEHFLKRKLSTIKNLVDELSFVTDSDYIAEIHCILDPLLSSNIYDEMKNNLDIKLKNLPKDSSVDAKKIKEQITKMLKEFQDYFPYENKQEILAFLLESKEFVAILLSILIEMQEEVFRYKNMHQFYEFTDISKLAIRIATEYPEIQTAIQNQFSEILIDEYQDTSDLQEMFISAISKQNVYMVGDIKQSIYRFRNANPYIFKKKYDAYAVLNGGFKIDLMKNFRSRKEVLNNINYIFDFIMDEVFGGCKYREEHQMVFGNTLYEKEQEQNQSADFEVCHYRLDQTKAFTKDEIEAFYIAEDIFKKVKNHYQVLDKKTSKLRNCVYADFTILMDRASKFDLYKKIFEFRKIPLAVYQDTSITKEDDIYLFNNLLKCIYFSYHEMYQEDFRYAFVSVARSYLTNEDDASIFKIVSENRYFESDTMKKIQLISKDYDSLNGSLLLEKVIDVFQIYKRQILVGNVHQMMARVSYLKKLFQEMGMLGYSLDEIIFNFDKMVQEEYDIKVNLTEDSPNAVKIMTIHKSKGLEFPVLYMAGLSNQFNIRDLNEKFIYDNTYGIILPFYKDQEIPNILKILMKETYIQEEISEKIRLFYVALTRAKEKMILLACVDEVEEVNVENVVRDETRYQYRSFLDMLKSIWEKLRAYQKEIDLDTIPISKDYNLIKTSNYQQSLKKTEDIILYEKVSLKRQKVEQVKFSKQTLGILSNKEYEMIELGKKFHLILENLHFLNPDFSCLSKFEKKHVEAFLQLPIFEGLADAKIYKEYEFLWEDGDTSSHGVIDLLIEFPDKVLILDYKLKQLEDLSYQNQLQGYYSYIKRKTDKPIKIYLYSILDHQLKEYYPTKNFTFV